MSLNFIILVVVVLILILFMIHLNDYVKPRLYDNFILKNETISMPGIIPEYELNSKYITIVTLQDRNDVTIKEYDLIEADDAEKDFGESCKKYVFCAKLTP